MTCFYVFMDADGTLHPAPPKDGMLGGVWKSRSLPLEHLRDLEDVLRPHLRSIEIIISSSWRNHASSLRGLTDAMSDDVRERVKGVTPTIKGASREEEIHAWLDAHPGHGRVVLILDDASPSSEWYGHAWIQPDPTKGLGIQDLERLKTMLAAPSPDLDLDNCP